MLDGEFAGAVLVVEGVGRHWVVVHVVVDLNIKKHAVGLAVSETLALLLRFAEGGAGSPSVLGASRVEEVGGGGLGIAD